MNRRSFAPPGLLTAAAFAALVPLAAAEASGEGAQHETYTSPRTPWGDPDLRGHWLPGERRPVETPVDELWRQEGANIDSEPPASLLAPDPNAPPRAAPNQTPLVVDPPDGKIPLQPWAAAKRAEIMANQDKLAQLDPRVKCLSAGLPRANLPYGFNTYQILQVPGYVVILYEANHEYRYIPLDGPPHVSSEIRLGLGDSRGHWEGDTLVVDVTNFTEKTWVVARGVALEGAPASALSTGHGVFHSDALHVVERFTLTDADTIHYEATIEDPKVFTRPWTIALDAFKRAPEDHILYEYACHEGNGRNLKLMTGVDVDAPGSSPVVSNQP